MRYNTRNSIGMSGKLPSHYFNFRRSVLVYSQLVMRAGISLSRYLNMTKTVFFVANLCIEGTEQDDFGTEFGLISVKRSLFQYYLMNINDDWSQKVKKRILLRKRL